jgi:hypothetical protein
MIGFIMVLSAMGMFFSGLSNNFGNSTGAFPGMITLGVIGFIFLAIATKGEICNGC